MKVTGIIVEYNPLHNGHIHHINESKRLTNCDALVAVMSGNFVQRGEPAILDKWKRAEAALLNGVDLVVELPVFYSSQAAEIFSIGSVAILKELKADHLVFGSESGDINELHDVSNIFIENREDIDELIKDKMNEGLSYPNAVNIAMAEMTGKENVFTPNNILGVEYLKAIKKLGANIEAMTIKRKNSGYYDDVTSGSVTSATNIRRMYFNNMLTGVKETVPEKIYNYLEDTELSKNNIEGFFQYMKYRVLVEQKFQDINDIEIGLDNRILHCIEESNTYQEFQEKMKTKRFTLSRISRVMNNILIDLRKTDVKSAINLAPVYIRVLGFNEKGKEILKRVKKDIEIPVITNLKSYHHIENKERRRLFEKEMTANKVYKMINKDIEKLNPIIK